MPGKFSDLPTHILLFCCLIFICAVPAIAQTAASASIGGDVKDADGGPLPGVMITVSGPGGNKTAYSDAEGKFEIPNVAPGVYSVSAALSGFVTVTQTDVRVEPGGSNTVSLTLKQGGLAEMMVVTASKVETPLINAPATMSVVNSDTIASSPAQNYGDLLRSVPGVNVTQTSARDINITSRQANSTLATSQLALLDGRTIYLDFFGFIAWDFLPVNFDEIKQIEVIRGPASAVWGANAQTGVVNIITKSPRETVGTSVTLTGGVFDRSVDGGPDLGNGSSFGANVRFAQIVNDEWSYKLSGGYYTQDPLARPAGLIPVCSVGPDVRFDCPPIGNAAQRTGGVPYSLAGYKNQGTSQPKFDARMDQDLSEDTHISYSGGIAGTDGIIHTGIGPFDIQSGTYLGYGKVGYTKKNVKLNFFANFLDGDAINQFGAIGPTGPIDLIFKNQTYDFEGGDSLLLGDKNIVTFGGNYRRNNFDISIAPNSDNRNEFGGYIQDEFFTDRFRLVVGGRVDKFSVIDRAIFSPRVTFMFKPTEENSIRVSYNRAFRSPSAINNFLDTAIINAFNLGLLNPALNGVLFVFPTLAKGNQHLTEESLTAYEVGYTGEFNGRTTVGVSYYINNSDNNINFTPAVFYSSLPPNSFCSAAGHIIPCPVDLSPFIPLLGLPALFNYQNFGPLRQQGVELSLDEIVNNWLSVYANYSYQKTPEILDNNDGPNYPLIEVIFPPKHRLNTGVNFNGKRYLGSVSVNYQSEAFWTDVLDAHFFGPTDAFTQVNASFGYRWMDGRLTTSVKVNNLFNHEIQQHIFGDILKRSITFEGRFDF